MVTTNPLQLPPPGRLVEIENGRKIHMECHGKGLPVVLLEGGISTVTPIWNPVIELVSPWARVCAYDRAGMGWSDPGPEPRTSEFIAEDLNMLLAASKLPPPYVLVGWSFGGLNVRVFANKYPEKVAALVLLDAAHEDEKKRMPQFGEQDSNPMETLMKKRGAMASKEIQASLHDREPLLDLMKEAFPKAKEIFTQPQFWKTMHSEIANMDTSCEQARKAKLPADMPLVVLACTKNFDPASGMFPPDFPFEEAERIAMELQVEHATLTSHSAFMTAESDHWVPVHKPDAVALAIEEALAMLKKDKS